MSRLPSLGQRSTIARYELVRSPHELAMLSVIRLGNHGTKTRQFAACREAACPKEVNNHCRKNTPCEILKLVSHCYLRPMDFHEYVLTWDPPFYQQTCPKAELAPCLVSGTSSIDNQRIHAKPSSAQLR